jgi:thioesterase domain-containing protein
MTFPTTTHVERYLYDHIPISEAMGVQVREVSAAGVRLWAPLGPNINHQKTIFGGSASAVAILSAWSLVYAGLHAEGVRSQIVIQRNKMEYLLPMEGDLEAFCPAPPEEVWRRFFEALQRRGRGRLELSAELAVEGTLAGRFRGTYVAIGFEAPVSERG